MSRKPNNRHAYASVRMVLVRAFALVECTVRLHKNTILSHALSQRKMRMAKDKCFEEVSMVRFVPRHLVTLLFVAAAADVASCARTVAAARDNAQAKGDQRTPDQAKHEHQRRSILPDFHDMVQIIDQRFDELVGVEEFFKPRRWRWDGFTLRCLVPFHREFQQVIRCSGSFVGEDLTIRNVLEGWVPGDAEPAANIHAFCAIDFGHHDPSIGKHLVLLELARCLFPDWVQPLAVAAPWREELDEPFSRRLASARLSLMFKCGACQLDDLGARRRDGGRNYEYHPHHHPAGGDTRRC
mmetsp:Transcript_21104/g.58702  ORF Transcript_21104/g.58702 Transcript_21104/m.58702 type:complete len:297 (+) Transcript_21104:940-1830(+)